MTHPEMTVEERLLACIEHDNIRAPRAQQIADLLKSAGFEVSVHPWTTSTDSKIPSTRLRRVGLGRKGKLIEVYPHGAGGERESRVLRWETSELYRTNREFAREAAKLLGWD